MISKPETSLRVISLNVNGLRSSATKGVIQWLEESGADIVCLQETRLQPAQWLDIHKIDGWHVALFPAQKAGYSGTAIYSRLPWKEIRKGLLIEQDPHQIINNEGRLVSADIEVNGHILTVASVYFPSGSSSAEAQQKKDLFLQSMTAVMEEWRQSNRSVILCGDVNIAHKKIDIKNWKANEGNSGFLPHERAWMDDVINRLGYIDAFRQVNDQPDEYSWWSNRGQAWAKNVGWRIDYHLTSPDWRSKVLNAFIYREQRFSDHAPVIVDYQI